MAGVKEIKDLLALVIQLGNSIGDVAEDGDIDLGESIGALIDVIVKVPEAIDGFGEIPSELSDLDEEEIQELLDYIVDELDLPQESVEEAVEDHLIVAVALFSLLNEYYLNSGKEEDEGIDGRSPAELPA